MARIIRVPREALPAGGTAAHLEGVGVGMLDQPDTENARDLGPLLAANQFDPGTVNGPSRALVVVFQTWLGVNDGQVLINLRDGKVSSIDHGDCFGQTSNLADPVLIITSIPGVDAAVGKDKAAVEIAVNRVEEVTDKDLLEAVSRVPGGEPWKGSVARRVEIAHWLAHRRGRLREVMDTWLKN